MAIKNALSDSLKRKFEQGYENNFGNISSNLMVHESQSVYNNAIKDKRKNLADNITTKSEEIIKTTSDIMETIIKNMRAREEVQAEKLELFCYSRLRAEASKQEIKILKNKHELFLNEKDFLKKIKLLNYMYFKYSTKKLGIVLNKDGYYEYTQLFEKQEIKDIMSATFNEFIKVFTGDSSNDSNTSNTLHINGQKLDDVTVGFNKFMSELLSKQQDAENKGEWDQAGVYESIIQYCSGRGISFINYYYKTLKNFENAQNTMINSTSDERLQNIYRSAAKHTVHKTIKSKNSNDKTIEGSFYGSIKSPNRSGIILEYLEKGLFLDNKITFSKDKIKVENTGKKLNVLGKSQKNDILLTFDLRLNPSKKSIGKNLSSGEKIDSYINSSPSQLGISIKNYTKDNDVTVHSAGNLTTVTNFLKTYNPIKGIKELCNILDSSLVKYILINDRNQMSTALYTALRKSMATQGAIFTLTPFLVKNGKEVIDESVDFFLVDQVLIPGSLIMQYVNNATAEGFNQSKARARTGFYVQVQNNSNVTDETIEKYNSTLPKPIKTKKGKDDEWNKNRFPYHNVFVNSMGGNNGLGQKVFNKITFRVEMRNTFRKNLQSCVKYMEEGNNG